MNIQKITTIVCASLGLLGVLFLGMIIGKGDDAIEMSAMQGDYGSVSYIIMLAQLILGIAVLITLVFSAKNLASDKQKLKRSLMGIGAFVVVILIAFLFSSGEETPMKDGELLSASGSRWVGTGLRTFYILAIVAVGVMLYSGVKRFLK